MEGLTGSTRNSHRLLLWAAEEHGLEAQDRLVDRLFEVGGGAAGRVLGAWGLRGWVVGGVGGGGLLEVAPHLFSFFQAQY